ncbi:MAG TPA: class I SAM-dependent methyltransferase [Geminicoccaceae bacterium]|nr:class I SAM-dependent methyltransferase [Geminicoccaceae bacterium]
MGFYERRILPRLIDFGTRRKPFGKLREELVGRAHGRVLEIGIGSGRNLPFYPRDLEILLGLDPSGALLQMARRQATWVHFPVELSEGRAEDIPLDDLTVDHVVMTWTLCSVADPAKALSEVRRVLRPGGSLLFIEHGRSPDPGVRRWQERLTPLWRRLAGGCHLDRPIDRLIQAAGLRLAEIETGYLVPGPRVATYHYHGRAIA